MSDSLRQSNRDLLIYCCICPTAGCGSFTCRKRDSDWKRGLRYIQRQSRGENKATAKRVLKALCTGAESLETECRKGLPATISRLHKSVILSVARWYNSISGNLTSKHSLLASFTILFRASLKNCF